MNNWLNEDLKQKVRKHFEPKYKRKLTDEEVQVIANKLVNLIEIYAKFRWKNEYGKQSI